MGIRIRKVLGYGVQDFKSPELAGILDREESILDFVSFCKEQKDLLEVKHPITSSLAMSFTLLEDKDLENYFVYNIINHDDEFGIPGVMVMIPPEWYNHNEVESWYRHDNIIDYMEETTIYPDAEPRVVELNYGIYPYSKGEVPLILKALCRYINQEDLYTRLKEMLYVYWA